MRHLSSVSVAGGFSPGYSQSSSSAEKIHHPEGHHRLRVVAAIRLFHSHGLRMGAADEVLSHRFRLLSYAGANVFRRAEDLPRLPYLRAIRLLGRACADAGDVSWPDG